MRTQRTKGTAKPAIFVVAGMLTLSPVVTQASPANSVKVQSIQTRSAAGAEEVVIRTSEKATYSVFRLSEPFRVLVDISHAEAAELKRQEQAQGLVKYTAAQKLASEGDQSVRVEIGLRQAAEYTVRNEGDRLVVRIEASTAPAVAAPKAKLGKVRVKHQAKASILSARIDGELSEDAVKMEALQSPSRLVIDLKGTEASPKWQRLKVGRQGVKRARVATNDEGVRIVLDVATKTLPLVEVDQASGKLLLSIKKAPVKKAPAPVAAAPKTVAPAAPKAEVAQAPVVEPAPAPVAAAPIVEQVAAPAAMAKVSDIGFEPKDGFVRLTLTIDGDADALSIDKLGHEAAPMLELSGVELPQKLERTLDVTELARSVVTAISTYNQDGKVMLTARIGSETEHRHWRRGNRLMWDFRSRAAEVVPYAQQTTAGYSSQTAADAANRTISSARRYKGRRITLDVVDADIHNVLRILADVSKLNIVAAGNVRGKVTIKLRNVPWDQALDIILKSLKLDKVRTGNILRIASAKELAEEEELRVSRAKEQLKLEPLSVRLIPVSYASAKSLQSQVRSLLSERGQVDVDTRTNVLVVQDIAEALTKVERMIRTLDTQTPQVLIEARIVEARSNFNRELGIQWGGNVSMSQQFGTQTGLGFPSNIRLSGGADDTQNQVTEGVVANPNYAVNLPATVGSGGGGALGLTFGSLNGAALVNLRLSAAEASGKVKIVSSPKIVTLDNKKATIIAGERVPITVITANGPTTRFISANIELEVTPHVTQDGSILMNVKAKRNALSDRRDFLGVPGIFTREAATQMIVRDGDTAVLGGLYQRNASENESYVPWLGKIPVLGWLFKTQRRSDVRDELLIFISPRIVNRSAALLGSR